MQVGEALRQAIGMMLADGSIKDPRVTSAMVTVTDVAMTPDLRSARVFISVFPEEPEVVKGVFRGLRSASSEMRREIGARVELRVVPVLEFKFDESVIKGARIEALLREINDDERGADAREDGQTQPD